MFLIMRLVALRVTDLGTDEAFLTVIQSDRAGIIRSITVGDKSSDVTFRPILSADAHCNSRVYCRIS